MLKHTIRLFPLMFLLLFVTPQNASAQNGSIYFGGGTAMDSASGQGIDTFGPADNDALFFPPKMGGAFGTIGADVMFRPYLGFGGETSFRFSQGSYAGLNYRPTFYDFNVILQPLPESKVVVPEFQAGLGGTKLSFYYNQQYCDQFAGCSGSNSLIESSNHFQLHFAGGVRFYVKPSIFIRPQVDVHWVNNFFQFGSSVVPAYSVVVGYTFGK